MTSHHWYAFAGVFLILNILNWPNPISVFAAGWISYSIIDTAVRDYQRSKQ